MPKVSRLPLKPEELQRIREAFLQTLASLRSQSDVEEFLQDFLTPAEWRMLTKRLAIAEMLLAEKSYATIQGRLRVANMTIARMQNFLQLHGGGLRKAVKHLKTSGA